VLGARVVSPAVFGVSPKSCPRGTDAPFGAPGTRRGPVGATPTGATGTVALVRLRRREDKTVGVRFCAVRSRAVSNRNCVVATRGGEQRNENDQSVTQVCRVVSCRELDSVGVDGRAFERQAKPVGAGANPLAAGRSPVVAPMVGDGMAGSRPEIIRETCRGKTAFMAPSPEEPPGGSQSVRSSEEAGNDRGAKGRRKVEA